MKLNETKRIIKSNILSHLSPSLARTAKYYAVYPRFVWQRYQGTQGFRQFRSCYSHQILFIAGLPKSGTTWLEQMLASYPGFYPIMPPSAVVYELATGGSHDYELPPDIFSRLKQKLIVLKLHAHGSPHNVNILRSTQIPYVILYRDLRDVALSYYFYVRQTPWHPEYPLYTNLSVEEALMAFADQMLPAYAQWIIDWHTNRDSQKSLLIRYEDLVQEPYAIMTKVASLFELDDSPQTIQTIVDNHKFEQLSGGRKEGQQSKNSFFRKGIVGDWSNHFTPPIKTKYKHLIGDFLVEFGYECDYDW